MMRSAKTLGNTADRIMCVCILGLAFVLADIPLVPAHAPSEMVLAFNATSHRLNVTIEHIVSSSSSHYVYLITVEKNGAAYSEERYQGQPTANRFSHMLDVDALPGDVLKVFAECNLGGSRVASLQVKDERPEQPPGEQPEGPPEEPPGWGALSLWSIHATLMVVGFILCSAGAYSTYLRGHRWWFRFHKIVSTAGAVAGVLGLVIASYMVALSGGPHIRVSHAYIGVIAVIFLILGPVWGYVFLKAETARKRTIRTIHVWWGRASIVLMALAILSGLSLTGMI